MADPVPIVALLGQSNAMGANSAALLPGSYPAYAGAQTNYHVWNWTLGTPAFETYEAGVNSALGHFDTTVFGPEIAWAGVLRDIYRGGVVTDNVALFKYAVSASSLSFIASFGCWSPTASLAYTTMLAHLQTCLATTIGGEPVDLKRVVWIQGETDAVHDWSTAVYHAGLAALIRQLRTDLGLPNLEFVIYQIHDGYNVSAPVWDNLLEIRKAQSTIADNDSQVGRVNTDSFALLPDSTHWTVQGVVEASLALEPAILNDFGPSSNGGWEEDGPTPATVADLYILFGQSNAEGAGDILELPPYLAGALSDVKVWQFSKQPSSWDVLEAGVNEQSTSGSTARVGMTPALGYELRKRHPNKVVHILKYAVDSTPLTPVQVVSPFAWDPSIPVSAGGLYEGMVAELDNAVSALLVTHGFVSVVLHGAIWCQGETDSGLEMTAKAYGGVLRYLVEKLRSDAAGRPSGTLLVGDTLPFIICQTHRDLNPTSFPYTSRVRAGQDAVHHEADDTGLVDMTAYDLQPDQTHLTTEGLVDLGFAAVAALDTLDNSFRPLFIPTFVDLQKRLRLTGVPETTDAMEMIREGMREARTDFYRRLTSHIGVLLSYAHTSTPSTEGEYLRAMAEVTEAKIVRAHLLRTLKVLFEDGSQDIGQAWNEVGLGRNMTSYDMRNELKRLASEIEDNMQILEGSETLGEETSVEAYTIGPETDDDIPGPRDSIFGGAL